MRFARTAIFAVATVLLLQGAFAFEKKPIEKKPVVAPVASPVVAAPVYVPKFSYCFVPKVAKKTTPALCPPGFTLVAAENRCKKDAGFECPKGYTLSVDAFGAAVCKYCKTFYSVASDGKCALPCKSGYDVALIKGIKYCVQSCKEGFYSTGSDCISTKKQYKPKECSDKLCLPNFKLYFTAPGADMTSGRKLSEAKPMAAATKPSSTCVCALTDPRDVYEQPCHDPYLKAATKVTKYEPAVCPNNIMPILGVCLLQCPSNAKETIKGECQSPCPIGSYPCKTLLLEQICVKGSLSYAKSENICKAALKVKLDRTLLCPVPSPAPIPSPNFKPSPPPKAKKFAKELPDLSSISDKITGSVKDSVKGAVASKLG